MTSRYPAGGVYNVLKRRGLNRLPERQHKRPVPTILYEKQVPGEHVQVDVKFLDLKTEEDIIGFDIFFNTAFDLPPVFALSRIYRKYTEQHAIDFVDYVIAKFPSPNQYHSYR